MDKVLDLLTSNSELLALLSGLGLELLLRKKPGATPVLLGLSKLLLLLHNLLDKVPGLENNAGKAK